MKKTSAGKTGFFRGMLDGLRSTVSQPSTAAGAKAFLESEVEETLKSTNFKVETVVRHGFPYQPTAIAFDPVQRLIAIGTKNGQLRLIGRPGVDLSVRHVTEFAVIQIIFLVNDGQLITICADDSLHLWNLRSKKIEIVHSLKFQKERITFGYLSFQCKWLYIGTERGNTYMVNVETFTLSGYVVNWNKAIELSRKTHPGSIIHLSDCPIDSNKLLIGFESGSIVLWDLRNKCADFRHAYTEGIRSISWHSEGRQFICSHNDGSLSTWNVKAGSKPQSSIYPHCESFSAGNNAAHAGPGTASVKELIAQSQAKPEACNPIMQVEWRTVRNGDAYIMFSGGMPIEPNPTVNSNQILTVIHGKSTTVLEMEHDIVDFITLCESPFEADYNDPYAIVVLLTKDLVVVDLQTPGYPCFLNPYPMDMHESPVTYCFYLANCPPDLVRAFFTVGHKQNKRTGFSEREWPINGGEWGSSTVSYPELIITGHADGSIKVWDASGVNLQILYKYKSSKLFEKPRLLPVLAPPNNANTNGGNNGAKETDPNEDLFAIDFICFTAETRSLCVAGACSQVIVLRFNKHEVSTEVSIVEVSMNYDEADHSVDAEIQTGTGSYLHQASTDPNERSGFYPLRAKTGHHKRIAGFQAELICVSPWIDRRTPPYRILAMTHNVHANLLAYGTENSIVIIDLIQKSIVLNVSSSSLYGPSDPYQRVPHNERSKQSKRCTSAGPFSKDLENNGDADRCRSPVTENPPITDFPEHDQSHAHQHELQSSDPDDPIQSILESLETLNTATSSSFMTAAGSSYDAADGGAGAGATTTNTSSPMDSPSSPTSPTSEQSDLTFESADDGPSSLPILDIEGSSKPKASLTQTVSLPIGSSQDTGPKPPPRTKRDKKKKKKEEKQAVEQVNSNLVVCYRKSDESLSTTTGTTYSESDESEAKSLESDLVLTEDHFDGQQMSPIEEVQEAFVLNELCPPVQPTTEASETEKTSGSQSSLNSPTVESVSSIEDEPMIFTATSPPASRPPIVPFNGTDRFRRARHKLIDMRSDDLTSDAPHLMGKLFNKLDSFTRSRSSSMSSLENVGNESIQFIAFANTFVSKNDTSPGPTLWVGTSQGSVIVISLTMPENMDNRVLCLQTVLATPSSSIFRLKGAILNIGFMDSYGTQLSLKPDHWKDQARGTESSTPTGSEGKRTSSLTITRTGSGGTSGVRSTKISPTSSSSDFRDSHLVVITSEKQVRLIAMPSQVCVQKATITETSFAVRADVVFMKTQEALCLACYLGTGNIMVYSLPSLRVLMDADFLPLTDVRIARTIFFSTNGHGMYLSSPSELTKFTISAAFCENLEAMVGALYAGPKDIPEPPKQSFLKGLFGGSPSPLDREELFGESASGKPSKTTARLIPGSMEHAKAHVSNIGGEFGKLREGFAERGEKLGQLEDKTARMQNEAEVFGSVAHAVMLKYRDKKWYQF